MSRRQGYRTQLWQKWIDRFGLNPALVEHHRRIYSVEFAECLERCKDDDARMVLLGVKVSLE